jgi:hypothetical protein
MIWAEVYAGRVGGIHRHAGRIGGNRSDICIIRDDCMIVGGV